MCGGHLTPPLSESLQPRGLYGPSENILGTDLSTELSLKLGRRVDSKQLLMCEEIGPAFSSGNNQDFGHSRATSVEDLLSGTFVIGRLRSPDLRAIRKTVWQRDVSGFQCFFLRKEGVMHLLLVRP